MKIASQAAAFHGRERLRLVSELRQMWSGDTRFGLEPDSGVCLLHRHKQGY